MSESSALDYYLVLTGPRSAALTSRGGTRPWRIDHVYLFHAPTLLTEQRARGVKTGVAASVLKAHWNAAEIYPVARNPLLPLVKRETELLRLFASPWAASPSRPRRHAGHKAQAPGPSAQPLLNHDQPQTAGSDRTPLDPDKIDP
jgi:hypothetical protein